MRSDAWDDPLMDDTEAVSWEFLNISVTNNRTRWAKRCERQLYWDQQMS